MPALVIPAPFFVGLKFFLFLLGILSLFLGTSPPFYCRFPFPDYSFYVTWLPAWIPRCTFSSNCAFLLRSCHRPSLGPRNTLRVLTFTFLFSRLSAARLVFTLFLRSAYVDPITFWSFSEPSSKTASRLSHYLYPPPRFL